jgi:phage terminase large subunit GpA-like protein
MASIPSFFHYPAPDAELAVADWAEHHRVLTSRSAAEPGPYRIERTPYLREPMDALGVASPIQRVSRTSERKAP